jgi:hypothetical protein
MPVTEAQFEPIVTDANAAKVPSLRQPARLSLRKMHQPV